MAINLQGQRIGNRNGNMEYLGNKELLNLKNTAFLASRNESSGQSDNMRGFDPVSEDDMEDNGMSRYMDNNDEDGWD